MSSTAKPSLAGRIKGVTTGATKLVSESRQALWVFLVCIALAIVCFVVWIVLKDRYDTPDTIRTTVSANMADKDIVGKILQNTTRKGLKQFLATTEGTGLLLRHCRFLTVALPGCFPGCFPANGKREAVYSPQALELACKGGARAFVLDIWPSLDGRFAPILQVVEEGSGWRRTSMNSMEFGTALPTIVETIYTKGRVGAEQSTQDDFVILYLRLQKGLRPQTYDAIVAAIDKHAKPYLLDPSYGSCRGGDGDRLSITRLADVQGKIAIVANRTKNDLSTNATRLYPYINLCNDALKKTEYGLEEFRSMTEGDRTSKRGFIQSMLTFVVPPNDAVSENAWDWQSAWTMGIHCLPINLFHQDNPTTYFQNFSQYSYRIKTQEGFQNQEKTLAVIQPPKVGEDPGIGDGRLKDPPAFSMGILDPCSDFIGKVKTQYAKQLDLLKPYVPESVDADDLAYIEKIAKEEQWEATSKTLREKAMVLPLDAKERQACMTRMTAEVSPMEFAIRSQMGQLRDAVARRKK